MVRATAVSSAPPSRPSSHAHTSSRPCNIPKSGNTPVDLQNCSRRSVACSSNGVVSDTTSGAISQAGKLWNLCSSEDLLDLDFFLIFPFFSRSLVTLPVGGGGSLPILPLLLPESLVVVSFATNSDALPAFPVAADAPTADAADISPPLRLADTI